MKRALLILSVLLHLSTLSAKTIVWELFYNINGFDHNALLIVNDETWKGKCMVFCPYLESSSGYNAKIKMNLPPDYMAIELLNPTTYGWIPVTFHFNFVRNEYKVLVNRIYYPIIGRLIPPNEWDLKMYQYGMK